MGSSNFYKGEKKKKKKGEGTAQFLAGGPVFVEPKVTIKGKIKY